MRTLLLSLVLVCLLLCASAHAGTIQIVKVGAEDPHAPLCVMDGNDAQHEYRLYFGSATDIWSLQPITLDDADTTFSLNETTAASYGTDWEHLVDHIYNTQQLIVTIQLRKGNSVKGIYQLMNLGSQFTLLNVDFEFTKIKLTRSGVNWEVEPTVTYTLDAVIIPEPASIILAFLAGILAVYLWQRFDRPLTYSTWKKLEKQRYEEELPEIQRRVSREQK